MHTASSMDSKNLPKCSRESCIPTNTRRHSVTTCRIRPSWGNRKGLSRERIQGPYPKSTADTNNRTGSLMQDIKQPNSRLSCLRTGSIVSANSIAPSWEKVGSFRNRGWSNRIQKIQWVAIPSRGISSPRIKTQWLWISHCLSFVTATARTAKQFRSLWGECCTNPVLFCSTKKIPKWSTPRSTNDTPKTFEKYSKRPMKNFVKKALMLVCQDRLLVCYSRTIISF